MGRGHTWLFPVVVSCCAFFHFSASLWPFCKQKCSQRRPFLGGQKVLGDQKEPLGLTRVTPRPSLPCIGSSLVPWTLVRPGQLKEPEVQGGHRAHPSPRPRPPPRTGTVLTPGPRADLHVLPPLSPLLVPRPRSHQRYAQGDGGCVHGLAGDSPRRAGCRPGLAPWLPGLSGRSGSTRGFGEPSLSRPAVGWGSLGHLSLGREPASHCPPQRSKREQNPFPTGEARAQQDLPRDWGWGRLAGRGLSRPLLCKKP